MNKLETPFYLTEAQVSKHPLLAIIKKSESGKLFKDIKIVEAGSRLNSSNKKLNFVRIIFKIKKIFMLEFLSSDTKWTKIDGMVIYNNKLQPEKTIYSNEYISSVNFFNKDLYEFLTSESFINESTEISPVKFSGGMFLKENFGSIAANIYEKLILGFALIIQSITAFFFLRWVYNEIKANYDSNYASTTSEDKLNQFLFKDQKKDEEAFSSYRVIINNITNVINNITKGLVLYGKPGTSKTYMVRRTLYFAGLKPNLDYTITKGSSASQADNIRIIYSTLYEFNGKISVFDDFDSALEDINVINLLKAALDSYPIRIISMPDIARNDQSVNSLPSKFEFTGKIIIITNKEKINTAIMSRIPSINVDFTEKEFLANIKHLLKYLNPTVSLAIKEEVLEYIEKSMIKNPSSSIDFRRFSAAVDMRIAYPNEWHDLVNAILYEK
jgi:hypothetical protein